MPERIAIKRLTASDLTFFETLYRTLNAGNQKAINLNADVFVDRFYPALPGLVHTLGDAIPVSLTILGPDGAPAQVISRAVTKGVGYKNWRLNGEFIRDPENQVGRFNILSAGDLAVMEFSGDPSPQRLTLLLIAKASTFDGPLHAALNPIIPGGRRTMIEVSRDQLAGAVASVSNAHPIWLLAADPEYDAALEDAALDGLKGTETLFSKVTKPVSAATLAAAKAAAEKIGSDGEAVAWIHLQRMKAEGLLSVIEWTSRTNAVSPFDFRIVDAAGKSVRIDAKSTTGEFERLIHVSTAELVEASADGRYDLWRIYRLDEDGARLRIAEDIALFAKAVLDSVALPSGVTIDSVSIDPTVLSWGDEIEIERPEDALDFV